MLVLWIVEGRGLFQPLGSFPPAPGYLFPTFLPTTTCLRGGGQCHRWAQKDECHFLAPIFSTEKVVSCPCGAHAVCLGQGGVSSRTSALLSSEDGVPHLNHLQNLLDPILKPEERSI